MPSVVFNPRFTRQCESGYAWHTLWWSALCEYISEFLGFENTKNAQQNIKKVRVYEGVGAQLNDGYRWVIGYRWALYIAVQLIKCLGGNDPSWRAYFSNGWFNHQLEMHWKMPSQCVCVSIFSPCSWLAIDVKTLHCFDKDSFARSVWGETFETPGVSWIWVSTKEVFENETYKLNLIKEGMSPTKKPRSMSRKEGESQLDGT